MRSSGSADPHDESDAERADRNLGELRQEAGLGVFDMTRTRFCDPAGLHALLGAHKRARAEGGEVRFVVTGPAVRQVLAIMAIDRVIPVFGRLDEALAPPARSDLSG